MENTLTFALISIMIYLVGAIPYTMGIFRWKVLPHIFSNVTWGILEAVNFLILLKTHAWWSLLPAGILLFFSLIYVIGGIFSFRKISINWFDYLCLFFACIALVLWWTAPIEYVATMTVVVDIIAFLPVVKKGWIQPQSEYLWAWIIAMLFPLFLMLASSNHTFANMAFWTYSVVWNGSFAIMLWYKQRKLLG